MIHLRFALGNKEALTKRMANEAALKHSTAHDYLNRVVPGSKNGIYPLLQHQLDSDTSEVALTFI